MKRHFSLLWMWITALLLQSLAGNALAGQAVSGFNVNLDPGIQVVDKADGSSLVAGRFKLFKGQTPSQSLNPGDFSTCVDNQTVSSTIIAPNNTTVRKMADVVFCMDISGSMGGEIQAVKNNTSQFVQKLTGQNYDVQLGLITFGQSSTPYLRQRNNGQFYTSPQDFITEFGGLQASGGREEWFDCLVQASQYPYRSGADRIAILITDENGDGKSYNINTAMPVVVNNAAKVYGVSYSNLSNVVKAVKNTGGELFNITGPFDRILDKIADSIFNTYTVSTNISVALGQHTLCVEPVSNPAGKDEKPFKVGANPVVALTPATQQLISDGIVPGTTTITVDASVIDQDGTVQTVNILWSDTPGQSGADAMSAGASNTYSHTYNGALNNIGDCFSFGIQAIDNEGRNTTVPANQGNNPGGKWHICVNIAPVVGTISPDTYSYQQEVTISAEVTDDQTPAVHLKYRESGASHWSVVQMTGAGTTFSAAIPAAAAGFKGLEVEVVAQDQYNAVGAKAHTLSVLNIPVTIIAVTRHIDTLDTGPFSVHAVAAGLDLAGGGVVELNYNINGGSYTALPMTQAVTGTTASMPTNSNIYVEEIPAVNLGDKVCYHVLASNPTDSERSQDICFDVLQPADPLAVTPASALLAVGDNAVEFMAKGGYGNYQWAVLNGDISTTLGDKTRYTPRLSGLDKISVTDLRGFTSTAIMKILPALAINPPVNGRHFSPSVSVTLTAKGGEPGYQWNVEGAAASQTSGSWNEVADITLGNDPVEIKVTLTDKAGRTVNISFSNQGKLRIDPASATIAANGEGQFTASGGVQPYSWKTVGGDIEKTVTYKSSNVPEIYQLRQAGGGVNNPTPETVTYKAPSVPGIYYLIVMDANGDYAMATVKNGDPLRVTPNCARLQRSEQVEFAVVTGTPSYGWETSYGSLSAVSGDKVTFTPEANLGLYEVRVYDDTGSSVNLCVEVADIVLVSKSSLTLQIGETEPNIDVSGGTAPYTWRTEHGEVSSSSGVSISYTAPATLGDGTDTITVRDNTGNEAVVQVRVVASKEKADEIVCTPESVMLAPGDTQQFTCNLPPTDISWAASAGDISGDGLFIAPASSGSVTVTAADIKRGRSFTIPVNVKAQLILTPVTASIGIGDSAAFSISGGESPYSWKLAEGDGLLDNNSGAAVNYTAEAVGSARVVVMDNTGTTAEAVITVSGDILLTPESAILLPETTRQFTVNGGTGTINFSVTQGAIDASGLYTAPLGFGSYLITATDGAGNKATANVTVANVPVITPANAWLQKDGDASFTVVGGSQPYTWKATTGQMSTTGNTMTYQAPGASTDVTVHVTDNQGYTAEARVYVDLPLNPDRKEIFVEPEGIARITVAGGLPPFNWQTIIGVMEKVTTEKATYNIYTAPNLIGDDTVIISDRTGKTAKVTVHVTTLPKVTPAIHYIERGKEKIFTVLNGVPPYTAIVKGGDGYIQPKESSNGIESNDGIFTFTAGTTANNDVVLEFEDSQLNQTTAHAYVEEELRVSPKTIYLGLNETGKFRITGGTGGYVAVADVGFVDIDEESSIATYYDAPLLGEHTITLHDSANHTVSLLVNVVQSLPVLSPATVTMEPGESRTFVVNRGMSPYDWHFPDNTWQGLDANNSLVKIIAPKASGSYELRVTDMAGNPSEAATVNVVEPLLLSPPLVTVYQGESSKVRFNATGLAGEACNWTLPQIGLEEKGKGADFIVVQPRTDVEVGTKHEVSCQANGKTTRANILVINLPGDLDNDGDIDAGEAKNAINAFFEESKPLDGVKIDRIQLFMHVESFIVTEIRYQ
ncbi:MAG: VWA domain-containing protein [Gammaproteobacteria bacterium]|nr:VWA domain-containing protein [Gammaproteobacteria bacterium]